MEGPDWVLGKWRTKSFLPDRFYCYRYFRDMGTYHLDNACVAVPTYKWSYAIVCLMQLYK